MAPDKPYVDVALRCYEMINRLEVDDVDNVEEIERALDLAIERRFAPGPSEHLLSDVLRNGRFSARRSRARRRRVADRYLAQQPRVVTGKRRLPGDVICEASPSADLAAAELHRELCRQAAECGPHCLAILHGLFREETLTEAAEAAGVSRATAHRALRQLRHRAQEVARQVAA